LGFSLAFSFLAQFFFSSSFLFVSAAIHISNSSFGSYFSGFSFLSNSKRSSIDILSFFVLVLLLKQYLDNQSRACHETANPIISFSHLNISSKENSHTSSNSNLSSNSSELSNKPI
jgi:hypothetical protein